MIWNEKDYREQFQNQPTEEPDPPEPHRFCKYCGGKNVVQDTIDIPFGLRVWFCEDCGDYVPTELE